MKVLQDQQEVTISLSSSEVLPKQLPTPCFQGARGSANHTKTRCTRTPGQSPLHPTRTSPQCLTQHTGVLNTSSSSVMMIFTAYVQHALELLKAFQQPLRIFPSTSFGDPCL